MKPARNITRSDVAVLLVLTAIVLCNVAAIGTTGRERAKRAVCLSNLKQLTQAWRQFADDHDGNLVNGAGGIYMTGSNKPWVGKCWSSYYASGGLLPEGEQIAGIRAGALWPYLQELNLYRCPSGYPGERLNYSVVDGMNGMSRSGTVSYVAGKAQGVRVGDTVVWIQNLSEILSPGPAERMVFIDEGFITPDSYNTHYRQETWWDDPPVRHNDGMTASFADGHAEHWQWQGIDTIEWGRFSERRHVSNNRLPQTAEGFEDLHRLQRAVWGRLGYEPTQ
ncbi:MAG TPA: hypothetical protein PLU87_03460 [Sedimentisphaerales bacterium]|nr:hypothetical protein [Sedimentisphaerales bacterium]HRS10081.1 hypothetical protein [Sedimentisphaerales bacterium]HRV46787.1 hypothetical protein [Sedimentisphaerales bacterium]